MITEERLKELFAYQRSDPERFTFLWFFLERPDPEFKNGIIVEMKRIIPSEMNSLSIHEDVSRIDAELGTYRIPRLKQIPS